MSGGQSAVDLTPRAGFRPRRAPSRRLAGAVAGRSENLPGVPEPIPAIRLSSIIPSPIYRARRAGRPIQALGRGLPNWNHQANRTLPDFCRTDVSVRSRTPRSGRGCRGRVLMGDRRGKIVSRRCRGIASAQVSPDSTDSRVSSAAIAVGARTLKLEGIFWNLSAASITIDVDG